MTVFSSEKLVYRLSQFILVLAALASTGGLLLPGLYRDSAKIVNVWKANDAVTLFIVVPLMAYAMFKTRMGSAKGLLLWTGILAYMLYNYAFYLFGAVFNWFFLVYVAMFAASIYALFIRLATINVADISRRFANNTPRKAIAVFLVLVALPLAMVEAGQCINFIISETVPSAPPLVLALDLSIVVPNTALDAILLWKNRPWGYLLAALMLVKSFTYGMVLIVATAMVAGFSLAGNWDPFMPFYLFVAAGGLLGTIVFLRQLNVQPKLLYYVSLYSSFHHYSIWLHPIRRIVKWYKALHNGPTTPLHSRQQAS